MKKKIGASGSIVSSCNECCHADVGDAGDSEYVYCALGAGSPGGYTWDTVFDSIPGDCPLEDAPSDGHNFKSGDMRVGTSHHYIFWDSSKGILREILDIGRIEQRFDGRIAVLACPLTILEVTESNDFREDMGTNRNMFYEPCTHEVDILLTPVGTVKVNVGDEVSIRIGDSVLTGVLSRRWHGDNGQEKWTITDINTKVGGGLVE